MSLVRSRTSNMGFAILNFDFPRWGDEANKNWQVADSVLSLATGLTGLLGPWENSRAYLVGQRVLDIDNDELYRCLVSHTAAASGTFEADRTANPTYWELITSLPINRGNWAASTTYYIADIVKYSNAYYYCSENHTSTGSFDGTKWELIFDLQPALTAETNAAASAVAADASADAALISQNAAAASAAAALVSQGAAATSASNALTSEGNADTSEANALASFLAMDKKFLGQFAADPTLDNQGAALTAGALYWNTGTTRLRIYSGGVWNDAVAFTAPVSAFIQTLLDDVDAATARTTLGALAAATYTAADVFAKVLTLDGAGSSLDADTLDGQHGSFYQNASNQNAGTLPDARLPARLGQYASAVGVVDHNTLGDFGLYLTANGSTNAPAAANHYVLVLPVDGDDKIQFAWQLSSKTVTDTIAYFRFQQGGAWTAWTRYRFSQDELDARYFPASANTVNNANLNSLTTPGSYYLTGTPTNDPTAVASDFCSLFVFGNNNTRVQLLGSYNGNWLYYRGGYDPGGGYVWEAWKEIIHSSNVATYVPATDYQAFTASGTWTKPAGLTGNELVLIELWGAGAGGRQNGTDWQASGGGGGEYRQVLLRASQLSATESVTIGAGSAGAASPSAGGNTSFKGIVAAGGRNSSAGLMSTVGHFRETGGWTFQGYFSNADALISAAASGVFRAKSLGSEIGGSGAVDDAAGTHFQPINSIYSGAGGGSAKASYRTGGTSQFGGAGGTSTGTAGGNGSAPGGGGAGGTSTAGSGARGEARITVIRS